MKRIFLICCAALVCFSSGVSGQIPTNTLIQIVKAEDERRFDKTLETFMANANPQIRLRAALAAGRIGDERAVPVLAKILQNDSAPEIRAMAAFALGETESAQASDAILQSLKNPSVSSAVRARLTEAAGKIAAASPKDARAAELGKAIVEVLETESRKTNPDRSTVLLGLTAILRARPENGAETTAKFLSDSDARVRADALNALARLRAKNSNEKVRQLLQTDADAVVRANAARVLGAAEDKSALNSLLRAALADGDSRVRVSAIRALGSLQKTETADALLSKAETLLSNYKKSNFVNPVEKNELLEIAATLGRILPNTRNARAINFLSEYRRFDGLKSPEIEIAFAKIAPELYVRKETRLPNDAKVNTNQWQFASSLAQGLGEIANLEAKEEFKPIKEEAKNLIGNFLAASDTAKNEAYVPALPDWIRAYAAFKPENLGEALRPFIRHKDVIVRAAVVELLGELPTEQIQFGDFEDSFRLASEDAKLNDALLATIEAVGKQKTERATDFLKHTLLTASMRKPDYLAHRRVVQLLKEKGADGFSDKVVNNHSIFTPADYRRAVSRKSARAIITTAKGSFTIAFFPEDAPLAVDNFIKLARSGYFNNVVIHRVVPNFVMQDGDPRGDGNGGPGWQIRCEINALPYERGAVGMALSGKDTGGSQWFVTHSPQPHLDGGYTVFGRVNETGMKSVDNLVRGDKILSVKIVEGNLPQKNTKSSKR